MVPVCVTMPVWCLLAPGASSSRSPPTTQAFSLRPFLIDRPWLSQSSGALESVAMLRAGQREDNDEGPQSEDSDDEDTAFRTCSSAAQDRLAHRMRGEKMGLSHHPAIRDAIQERLAPIPRGVEADGPPK